MAIFIDTADVTEARIAKEYGWVSGITTNPRLLARIDANPEDILEGLAKLHMGPIFYQLTASDHAGMLSEIHKIREIVGEKLVLKLPPTRDGFRIINKTCTQVPCCVTALFSLSQAMVAQEAGAQYIAIYVNRATRSIGDGISLVRDMASVLKRGKTEILAASIKSSKEACEALRAGANHLTVSFDVLKTLIYHELSEEAVREFDSEGRGISYS